MLVSRDVPRVSGIVMPFEFSGVWTPSCSGKITCPREVKFCWMGLISEWASVRQYQSMLYTLGSHAVWLSSKKDY